MLVEPCVLNSDLFPFLKRLGYDYFLSEDGKQSLRRFTIVCNNTKALYNALKSTPKATIFVKPLSLDALKSAIIDHRVNAIILGRDNLSLFKKTMLSLISQYNKFVEVRLNEVTFDVIYRLITWSSRWIRFPLISSCAAKFNEVWSPYSKISLLTSLGASESDALNWVCNTPLELISQFKVNQV
ncbi:RNase P p30-like protein [Sulfolobus acidocaldarius]|uniref:Conserved RNase_P_p30-like protein n=4 Tax=Sulfolobus acidocaldarius TaxID=2285 RepID=Q4JB22_SULAC|nr:RNase P p30-like protein [Sulfolobus acidocaldarius]AAY80007.1 conserved RNase_P_p30-like protein [Sulfolobus acidocaldarius DSM 639]AGE70576.1 RNase_P_p30-like protein [Sulfolobus acidocaldarius N8]AGE72849.1 RNase_P_p30-like protein [Sulfolobus acidocaldarius Ron12/I]ALU29067.1 RNase P p30-like protein [Sulfolobus acidocaldarius]ALU31793.1 RNase P p30-like protein [Sulfolobus acidocaldarius]